MLGREARLLLKEGAEGGGIGEMEFVGYFLYSLTRARHEEDGTTEIALKTMSWTV